MAKRIDVTDLNVYYGAFKAVEGVSMTVEPRSVTALIGPSGCGKSTVLRTLNRMHEVIPGGRVEGKVMLDDQDLYAPSMDPVTVRRTIGMVFQRPNPFPTMSIYDNVAAGLRLNGVKNKKTLDGIVESSLKGANLWTEVKDRLGKPGAGLSGGQQQRLCIARAIAVQPQVLLMDEPCSALDPISTLAIEDLINELKSDFTIVIVTHNMQQAARVSDRTAFFNLKATGEPGRLVEIDDTTRIFNNPSEQATEDYISGRSAGARCRRWRRQAGERLGRGGSAEDAGDVPGEDGDEAGPGEGQEPRADDVAGDAPAHGREPLGRTDAHDRRGDRVGRRDRGTEGQACDVEDRGRSGLGGEALRGCEVDDAAAQRAHDAPPTGIRAGGDDDSGHHEHPQRDRVDPRGSPRC